MLIVSILSGPKFIGDPVRRYVGGPGGFPEQHTYQHIPVVRK